MVAVQTSSLSKEKTTSPNVGATVVEWFVLASANCEIRLTQRDGTHRASFSVTLPHVAGRFTVPIHIAGT